MEGPGGEADALHSVPCLISPKKKSAKSGTFRNVPILSDIYFSFPDGIRHSSTWPHLLPSLILPLMLSVNFISAARMVFIIPVRGHIYCLL